MPGRRAFVQRKGECHILPALAFSVNMYCCIAVVAAFRQYVRTMKTTIDIPDPLYRQVKIRAVEKGRSLRAIVLESLAHELARPSAVAEARVSYWADRKLVPEYEAALKGHAFSDGTDSTRIISDERTSTCSPPPPSSICVV